MALYHTLFLILTALIYSGICMYNDQNPEYSLQTDDGELTLTEISFLYFVLQWSHDDFDGGDTFTVDVNSGNCVEEVTCTTQDCTFNSFNICKDFENCQDVTVSVTGGKTKKEREFTLAPFVSNFPTPDISVTDKILSITWETPVSDEFNSCATRARATVQVGSGDRIDGLPEDVILGNSNTLELSLPDCQHGDLAATVIYLSQTGDYDTVSNLTSANHLNYEGAGGVTKVTTEVLGESCSIEASWHGTCLTEAAGEYKVTWGPGDTGTAYPPATSYPIYNLEAKSYDVSVQAFWEDDRTPMGSKATSRSTELPAKAPGAPTVTGADGSGPKKLSVSWTPPTTDTCTGAITGYTVTCGETSEDTESDASTVEVTCEKPCTDYDVTVATQWSEGTAGTDTMKGKSGSSAPGEPKMTEESVTEESIVVSWTRSDEANSCPVTKYTVNWTPHHGGADGDAGTGLTYTITGLTCNTDYTITVTATAEDDKTSVSDKSISRTKDKVPEKVQDVNAKEVSDDPTQLEVTWTASVYDCGGGLTGYLITWEVDGNPQSYTADPSDDTYNITGLDPCTKYTANVAAISQKGLIGINTTVTGTTGIQAPAEPVLSVEADSNTPSSLYVSWTQGMINNCGITKYTIKWSPASGDGGNSADVEGTKTTFNITGLICNTNYTVTVTAFTGENKFNESNTETGPTKDQAPGVTTVALSPEDDPTQLTASWSPPDYDCIGSVLGDYSVTWTAEGDDHPTDTKDVAGTTFIIKSLVPCTNYTISVAARSNTDILGPEGKATATTAVEVPGQSTGVTRKDVTSYSLEVDWNAPSTSPPEGNPCTITSYTVQWVNSSGGEPLEETVTAPPYNITDLAACTDYTITVIAYTDKGAGEASDPKTLASGTDAPLIDAINITSKSRSAHVSWEKPSTNCELKYEVEYNGTTLWTNNQIPDSGKSPELGDNEVETDLKDLLPYSNYSVCVTVENGDTTCNTFITEEEVPSAPRDVAVKDGSVTDVSLTLEWQFPVEENGILEDYVVYWVLVSGSSTNDTVRATDTSYNITGLTEGNYSFTVKVSNSKGFSNKSIPIYYSVNGPPGNPSCGGGCIASIVVGALVVAVIVVVLAVPKSRHKIINTITPNKRTSSPSNESPYELTEAAILKTEFRNHVELMESDGGTYAYQMLNDESPQKNKFAASKPFNKGKNRYANIHPFDDTRVKLPLITNGPKGSDYINANHVTFPDTSSLEFIASQGPVDNTIGDFWRMIWEHSVYDVVMLCNLTENGKSKCAQYWNDRGERAIEIGEFKVYCQTEEKDRRNQCITRYIDIVKNDQRRLVKQHHYIAWPDHGVPQNEDDMLNFLASVKAKSNPHGKNTVVHCSAGVGRTGTFIGLWVLTNILNEERNAKSINVHRIAVMMRECRSDMVQTKGQYLYLHKCLLKYMENIDKYQDSACQAVEDEPIYGNIDNVFTGGVTNKAYQPGK